MTDITNPTTPEVDPRQLAIDLKPKAKTKATNGAKPAPLAAIVAEMASQSDPAEPAKGEYIGEPVHEIPATVDQMLTDILCWPRCHDTPEEQAFTAWLKKHIMDMGLPVRPHSEGAFSVRIPIHRMVDGKATEISATTLFSSHVDTMDWPLQKGNEGARKALVYDPNFGQISLDSQSKVGDCLGADDGSGVWIMMNMMKAGVPGTYLFHRGEEKGGISARAIRSKEELFLKQFQAAVAFDRHRTQDIITHQGGSECASDKYAARLAGMLQEQGFDYKACRGGVFTDVKVYRDVIPECINLAVGYEGQHGKKETQDYGHLFHLMEACKKIDWEALPIDRDPKKADPLPERKDWSFGQGGKSNGYTSGKAGSSYGGKPYGGASDRGLRDFDARWNDRAKASDVLGDDPLGDIRSYSLDDLEYTIENEPEEALKIVVALMRENARLRADVSILNQLLMGGR